MSSDNNNLGSSKSETSLPRRFNSRWHWPSNVIPKVTNMERAIVVTVCLAVGIHFYHQHQYEILQLTNENKNLMEKNAQCLSTSSQKLQQIRELQDEVHALNEGREKLKESTNNLKLENQLLTSKLESANNEVKARTDTIGTLNEDIVDLRLTKVGVELKCRQLVEELNKKRLDDEAKLMKEFQTELARQKESFHEYSDALRVELVWILDCLSEDSGSSIANYFSHLFSAVTGNSKAARCREAFRARYQHRLG